MKYSIIIPTYNHCDDLLKPCVEAVIKYSNLEDIELIIIANGCKDETDGYLAYLHSYFDFFARTTEKHLVEYAKFSIRSKRKVWYRLRR